MLMMLHSIAIASCSLTLRSTIFVVTFSLTGLTHIFIFKMKPSNFIQMFLALLLFTLQLLVSQFDFRFRKEISHFGFILLVFIPYRVLVVAKLQNHLRNHKGTLQADKCYQTWLLYKLNHSWDKDKHLIKQQSVNQQRIGNSNQHVFSI